MFQDRFTKRLHAYPDDHRPGRINQLFLRNIRFSFFLLLVFAGVLRAQTPGLYINEVSQGPSGNKEYVELLVVASPTCFAVTTLDLRGWYIDDNNGAHATGSGTGIAQGCVRFTQDPLWAAVPAGTLIVIHNDADPNVNVPPADLSLTDGNCRLVIPVSNCALLEKNTALPSTVTATYPVIGFTSCGSWTNVSMANTDDSFHTVTPAGAVFHSVSWGNNTSNTVIYFAGTAAGTVALMTNATTNNINTQANWSRLTVAGNESPGMPNNLANQNWICTMNNGCVAPTPITATVSHTNASCTCTGSATVTAAGGFNGCGSGYTYSWAPAGGNAATASNLCGGTYTCTITDVTGCTGTVTVNITSSSSMNVAVAQTNVLCFAGASGSATLTPTGGTGPYSCTWLPTGGNGLTATGLTAGTYTATVTDAVGCQSTTTVVITQPPVLLGQLVSQVNMLCNGGNAGSATASATGGTGPYTYVWQPFGGTNATAGGLTAGTYTAIITDANGCTAAAVASVTEPPLLTAAIAPPVNVACNGGATGAATVAANGGVGPYSYVWLPSGGTNATASGLSAGTYTAIVTDANGCSATASVTLTQPAALSSVITATPATCSNANGTAAVSVSGGTGSYTYVWAPAGGTAATATGLTAGIYTVTITDANQCVLTDTVTVASSSGVNIAVTSITAVTCAGDCNGQATIFPSGGTAPYTVAWPSGGTGLTETGLCAGMYMVNVTDAVGCLSSASINISQPAPLVVQTNAPPVLCIGQTVTLTATTSGGTPAYTEVWSPAGPAVTPNATATYTVTVTDANGCVAAAQTVTVNVNPPLTVIPSAGIVICPGNQAALAATAAGGDGNYTYTWTPVTSPATGPAVNASPGNTTTYTVTVTDGCGSVAAIDSITITVSAPPVITFAADTQSGCMPLCVTFTNTTPNSSLCAWDFGDNTTSTATCTPQHCYNLPGSYDVSLVVTDGNGCTGTLAVPGFITVYPVPFASFSVNPQPATLLDPVITFTDASSGAQAWNWDFGDPLNSTSVLQNTTFTYSDSGHYAVTLTVTNMYGCTDDTTVIVDVELDDTFYAPNCFTPDGDGTNDVFYPKGSGIDWSTFEMLIFDRWGNLIFKTTDINTPWDGRVQGKNAPAQIDVYVWVVNYETVLRKPYTHMGHISLVR